MAHSQTYFQNAHHFEVNDGNFFSISNTKRVVINTNTINNDPVSTTLWQHVATGAMFDSAERYPPGKCHPGTRENVSNKIVDWMDDLDPDKRILWLYGPAGSGKSAICQSLCERLSKTDSDRLGGSFFFARGPTDRGNGLKLFATLSYQLAIHFPSLRREINEALDRDPSLPTKSMDVQLFSLIIQPLMRCQPFSAHSPTLIIDGLDECADSQGMDIQRDIITLISQSIIEYNVPLRFMIASRPEFWIRDTFETAPLPNLTLSISLRDEEDADHDIRAYLTDEFERIRLDNKRIMGSVIPPWPPANIVERFVYEASGQFIYASTIVKFVGKSSRFINPQEQLRILTTPGPQRASAFSELDRLYVTILSAYPRWATMKRVLGGVLLHANATILEIILGVDPNEIILVSDALSALVDVKRLGSLSEYEVLLDPIFGPLIAGQETMDLCHLSFREFLEDETRSGRFHVDTGEIIEEITDAFFGIIHRNIDDNYAKAPHLSLGIGIAAYQSMMSIMFDVIQKHSDIAPLLTGLTGLIQKLLLNPDIMVDHIGCFLLDMNVMQGIWAEHGDGDENLNSAILHFESVASPLQKRHLLRLVSFKKMNDIHILSYLGHGTPRTIDEILIIITENTVADIISTFQEHCYLIHIYSSGGGIGRSPSWYVDARYLEVYVGSDDDSESRYRSSLVGMRSSLVGFPEELYSFAGIFFESRNLSDIHSSCYFQDKCNAIILESMTNFSVWGNGGYGTYTLDLDVPYFAYFICQGLCWFNRQLTNRDTLSILEHQDSTLVPKMRTTMLQMFQYHFLPMVMRPYHDHYRVGVATTFPADLTLAIKKRPVKLRVFPLTQSDKFQEEDDDDEFPFPHIDLVPPKWRLFHNEVFGKKLPTGSAPLNIIKPRDWHPYLSSYLFGFLITNLYRRSKPDFEPDPWAEEESKESFSCFVECYPYAETTKKNLDALRAIAYLFPKVKLEWDPPLDFWTSSLEFLKKYDRSILSYEELQLFEEWLDRMHREAMDRNQQ